MRKRSVALALCGWVLIVACAPGRGVPPVETCEARDPRNVDRPFGSAYVGDPPQTTLTLLGDRVELALRPLENSIVAGVPEPGLARELRDHLWRERLRIMELCARGGAPFDHTLQVVVDADLPASALLPLLEVAQLKGFEDVQVSWSVRRVTPGDATAEPARGE